MQNDMLFYENEKYKEGLSFIAGVDEAGRGPLAGPVVAAAVIFEKGVIIPEVNDSKKLTAKKREQLFDVIISKALSYKIEFVDEKTIDEINILNASMTAMKNAINGLSVKPDFALIDGNCDRFIDVPHSCIVKGDSLSMSIAAASILAKVARDRYMLKMDEKYPEYNFKSHKGYGTKEHVEKIKKLGVLPIHRKSFLKKIL